MKVIFGLYTMCRYDDGFQEPEGTVIYNECPPRIGTKVILCDKKTWVVTEVNKFNSTVYVERKQETEQEFEREQDADSR